MEYGEWKEEVAEIVSKHGITWNELNPVVCRRFYDSGKTPWDCAERIIATDAIAPTLDLETLLTAPID